MAMDIWFECNVRRLPAKGAREKEDRIKTEGEKRRHALNIFFLLNL